MNIEKKIKFDHDKKQFVNELNNRNNDIEKMYPILRWIWF